MRAETTKISVLHARTTFLESIAISRDGALAAAGYSDGIVRLWATATGALFATLRGVGNPVTALAVSSEHGVLATADKAGVMRVWDVEAGTIRFDLRIDREVRAIKIAPGEDRIAAVDNSGMLHLIVMSPDWSGEPSAADIVDFARASETDELSPEDRRRFVLDSARTRSSREVLPVLTPIRPSIREARSARRPERSAVLNRCDRLAADPSDIAREANGIKFSSLDGQAAFDACSEALTEVPDDLLAIYQRARAAEWLGRRDEARRGYQVAAERGLAAALRQISLGLRAVGGRDGEALDWVVKAAALGDPPALNGMARRYALGVEVDRNVTTALRYALTFDERSVAAAAAQVARVIEANPTKDGKEDALFFYWLALRWYQAEGNSGTGRAAAAERIRVLANLLSPEVVVKIYRRAQTWSAEGKLPPPD
jgi:hypothetical protein